MWRKTQHFWRLVWLAGAEKMQSRQNVLRAAALGSTSLTRAESFEEAELEPRAKTELISYFLWLPVSVNYSSAGSGIGSSSHCPRHQEQDACFGEV